MPEPTPAPSPADGITRQDAETLKSLKGTLSKKNGCGCLLIGGLGSMVLGGVLYLASSLALGWERIGYDALKDKITGYGLIGPPAEDVETVTHCTKDGKEIKKYTVQKGVKAKIFDFRDKRFQAKNDKGEAITIDDVVADLELMSKLSDSSDYDISESDFNQIDKRYQERSYNGKVRLELH